MSDSTWDLRKEIDGPGPTPLARDLDRAKHRKRMREIAVTSRGYTLFVEENEVGGRSYWSDEIGGGVMVWDTSLVGEDTLRLALSTERLLNEGKVDW
jgi:hypothetical protein